MSLKNWDKDKFGDNYSRALYNAVRRTAYEVGDMTIKMYRLVHMGKVKQTRKKLVNYKVHKNNTLVFVDRGYDARIREYGATIRPKAVGALLIPFDGEKFREQARRDKAKGRKRELFMLKRPGKDPIMMQKQPDGESKAVAVLKREVTRLPVKEKSRLSVDAARAMRNFDARVADFVEKEMK